MSKNVRFMTQAAAVAAVYVVLTLLFAPISFGQSGIECRISEALTILPMFTGAAVPGLFVGCVLANIFGGGIIWDIVFGSLATLAAAYVCRLLRHNRWLAPAAAVIANAIVVPLVLRYGYGVNMSLPLLMLSIGVGEAISAYGLGQILISVLMKYRRQIFRTE